MPVGISCMKTEARGCKRTTRAVPSGPNCHVSINWCPQLRNYSSDLGKQPRRVPKRRQAAQELSVHRRSALNVRLFLRDFCSEFLENCYNPLMGAVKVRAREGHLDN